MFKYSIVHSKICVVHICGFREFNADIDMEKTIQAPSYPGAYGNSMDCWYTIIAPKYARIRFWIDDFGTVTFHPSRFYLWVSQQHNKAKMHVCTNNVTVQDLLWLKTAC